MSRTLTGHGVLVWLGAFFGVIFAANLGFIISAERTFSGEDEQKPYLQGVEYNQTLARRAEQVRLGWQAVIDTERLAGGRTLVTVAVRRPGGAPQSGEHLVGKLRHPANENRDRGLAFIEVRPGVYQATLAGVNSGYWDVEVASRNGAPFQAMRRLWLS